MNMKKTLNWMLMAAMTMGLSLNFAACSSDDDDEKENDGTEAPESTDPYERDTEAAGACYNILSLLSVVGDELPNNWKTATFDVLEGKVLDESTPFVRSIVVNDLAEAVDYYNSLTNRNITTATATDSWKVDGVGTMEYTAVNTSACFATIDCNIKQLPKLTQIRMVPASVVNLNAAFDGEPYYRMGDVVKDKDNTYWICVRQCYSPDENDISHWLSFQIITATPTNLVTKTPNGMQTQKFLNNLGNQRPAMRYGAQLMAALARTNEFVAKYPNGVISEDKGLGGLSPDAMPNNELQQVSQAWEQLGIWELVKPSNMSVAQFKAAFSNVLTFAYNKSMLKSNTLEQPYVRYSDPANFFTAEPTYETATANMASTSIDMSTYVDEGTGTFSSLGSSALVVRHKNGFNLTGAAAKALSPTAPINSVTTVFRFAEQ
jgi:hypothetical protein